MKKISLLVFLATGELFIILFLLSIFFNNLPSSSPLVSLADPQSTYRLSKHGDNYFLEQINRQEAHRIPQESDFIGNAVKVSGSCNDLDPFLDQPVQVDGFFTTKTGEHSFFLSEIMLETDSTVTNPQ